MPATRDDAHDVAIHREDKPVLGIDACARKCVEITLEELCFPDALATGSGYVFEECINSPEGLLVLALPVLVVDSCLVIP